MSTTNPTTTTAKSTTPGWVSYAMAFGLLIGAGLLYWSIRPFGDTIESKQISLSELSRAQRMNIALAAKYLDEAVVQPGETFSFNRVVGPRSESRGYVPAPSYIEANTSATTGGGICLLSSWVYQLALESGMQIKNRTPHLRTIHTVAPGLDATVWYGQSDLVFVNTSKAPIKLKVSLQDSDLRLKLLSTKSDVHVCSLRRIQNMIGTDRLRVKVTRQRNGVQEFVSDDVYGVSPQPNFALSQTKKLHYGRMIDGHAI